MKIRVLITSSGDVFFAVCVVNEACFTGRVDGNRDSSYFGLYECEDQVWLSLYDSKGNLWYTEESFRESIADEEIIRGLIQRLLKEAADLTELEEEEGDEVFFEWLYGRHWKRVIKSFYSGRVRVFPVIECEGFRSDDSEEQQQKTFSSILRMNLSDLNEPDW